MKKTQKDGTPPDREGSAPPSRRARRPRPRPAPTRAEAEANGVPGRLPVLPLRSDVVFPQTVVPLVVNRPEGIRLIDEAMAGDKTIALVAQRQAEVDEPGPGDLHPTACVGTILKMLKFPDGSTRIVCQGMHRARLVELDASGPYPTGRVEILEEEVEEGVEIDALAHHVGGLFQRMVEQSQQVPEELQVAAMNTRDPGRLADLLGSSLPFSVEEKQELLDEVVVRDRLEKLGQFLARQLAVMELAGKIQAQVGSEISKAQREHFLRQQLKAIRDELGEDHADNPELDALWAQIKKAKPPANVLEEAGREIERLAGMHPSSAEYSILRTYLDWVAALPWAKSSRDRLDLHAARETLDADHYDLRKIKERILEYLAVRKLKKDMRGPILCFAGPPGTGKTSLGKSIARALGRQFVRISLGGVHDEAEIRGHRRTYVAAMPGRIIQGLRKAKTNNPVFMLDEVDKLGADFRGDPSAALLEVLDPEQNATFRDHYLDLDFDLSRVMFIATANMLQTIPPPLLDRMEVLELPGYSQEEKLRIARSFLIPKQLEAHGLVPADATFADEALRRIVVDYTREAGLRNLEREIASICRKVARRRAEGQKAHAEVGAAEVSEALGPPRFFPEVADRTGSPGVATGLAWTPVGGEILFIEATAMPGRGNLTLTGLLGDSMRESAQAALSYLRSQAKGLGIGQGPSGKTDLHIHVPAGAVPKDGPSAGVAIAAALISLFRKTPIRPDLAMTGEVTLTGRVLPVGGIREKVLAAHRAGIRAVIIPRHNEKDLDELPPEVRADLQVHMVDTLADVVAHLFAREPRGRAKAGPTDDATPKPKPRSNRRPATGSGSPPPSTPRRPRPG